MYAITMIKILSIEAIDAGLINGKDGYGALVGWSRDRNAAQWDLGRKDKYIPHSPSENKKN